MRFIDMDRLLRYLLWLTKTESHCNIKFDRDVTHFVFSNWSQCIKHLRQLSFHRSLVHKLPIDNSTMHVDRPAPFPNPNQMPQTTRHQTALFLEHPVPTVLNEKTDCQCVLECWKRYRCWCGRWRSHGGELSWFNVSKGESDRDRIVVARLLAADAVRYCWRSERRVIIRSGTSLAALALQSANALLAPFRPHCGKLVLSGRC